MMDIHNPSEPEDEEPTCFLRAFKLAMVLLGCRPTRG